MPKTCIDECGVRVLTYDAKHFLERSEIWDVVLTCDSARYSHSRHFFDALVRLRFEVFAEQVFLINNNSYDVVRIAIFDWANLFKLCEDARWGG